MDLNGQDACDMAKKRGLTGRFPVFNDCNPYQKLLPRMPDGKHANVEALVMDPKSKVLRNFEFGRQDEGRPYKISTTMYDRPRDTGS